MKKLSVLTAFIIALLLVVFAGCDPDKKSSKLTTFFEAMEKPLEQATFFVENEFVFVSYSGYTRVTIPAGSLDDANGNNVTGIVNLAFREIYTKGDMMRYNRPTQTVDDQPLESGGEMFLGLTQNDKPLKLKPGKSIKVMMKTQDPKEYMDVFYGNLDSQDGLFRWLPDATPDSSNVTIVESDTNNIAYFGYEFFPTNLGWINCDRFTDIPANQTVCAQLPAGFSDDNTLVYLVYTDRNSVEQLRNPGNDNSLCGGNGPLDDAVTFVSVSVHGNVGEEVYFLAHEAAVVTAGLQVELEPVETSLADIEAYFGSF
ncbi:MAG: hypothetical protein HY842_04095 [Bacteroidetes bacterium]|nr:hypothetical protein [Bacteroidota bacterium]